MALSDISIGVQQQLRGADLESRLVKEGEPGVGFYDATNSILSAQMQNGQLPLIDFFASLGTCLMIEAGFVPYSANVPLRPLKDLLELSRKSRHAELKNVLRLIAQESENLRVLTFKSIVPASASKRSAVTEEYDAKKPKVSSVIPGPSSSLDSTTNDLKTPFVTEGSSSIKDPCTEIECDSDPVPVHAEEIVKETDVDADVGEYIYGAEVKYSVIFHESIRISLATDRFEKTLKFFRRKLQEVASGALEDNPFTALFNLETLFSIARFEPQQFSSVLKNELIFELVDRLDSFCDDVRGFSNLPNELFFPIVQYLDVKSFTNFIRTCNRHRDILDSCDGWRLMLKPSRLTCDFRDRGFRVPSDSEIPSDFEGTVKEKYKKLYLDALDQKKWSLRMRRFRDRHQFLTNYGFVRTPYF